MKIGMTIKSSKPSANLPAPIQVEVTEDLGKPIIYTITFGEDVCKDDLLLLRNVALNPLEELTILIKVNDAKTDICLVKGPVKSHSIHLMNGGQGSTLKVSGADNSTKLGWKNETKTDWKRSITKEEIQSILDNKIYSFKKFNILKNFEADEPKAKNNGAKNDGKNDQQTLTQTEDDLTFINKIARQQGMYFWVSYETDATTKQITEFANFDSLPLKSKPEHQLTLNQEDNNIDSMEIKWDAERPTKVESKEIDLKTKKVIDGDVYEAPQPKASGEVTLKDLTGSIISKKISVPPKDTATILNGNKAALNAAEWFLTANCTLDFERLCEDKTIHAHTMIGVSGLGTRYSGNYVVSKVVHTIDAVSYKLALSLMRNTWLKTTDDQKMEKDAAAAKTEPKSK